MIDWTTDKISLSALKDYTSSDLRAIYRNTEVTVQGEVTAVLIPIRNYLDIQKLILDTEARIERMLDDPDAQELLLRAKRLANGSEVF